MRIVIKTMYIGQVGPKGWNMKPEDLEKVFGDLSEKTYPSRTEATAAWKRRAWDLNLDCQGRQVLTIFKDGLAICQVTVYATVEEN